MVIIFSYYLMLYALNIVALEATKVSYRRMLRIQWMVCVCHMETKDTYSKSETAEISKTHKEKGRLGNFDT